MLEDESDKQQSSRVNRRNLLKVIGSVPAVALIPPGSASALASPGPDTEGSPSAYKPKVFNPHEWETVRLLSDLIIPADAHSGSATEAEVPEFIDDALNLEGVTVTTQIIGGLAWLDMECNRLFERDFVGCSSRQQKEILDRIAYPEKASPQDSQAVAFFNRLRDLVLGGFYSSKMGIQDIVYVGNRAVKDWDGCPDAVISRLGVSYSH